MSSPGMTTIECPGCHRSLPPAAQQCQFCGSALTNVARPKAAAKKNIGPEPWVMKLYYAVAAYWILDGVAAVVMRAISLSNPKTFSSIAYLGIAIGIFAIALGIGLLLRWDWARGVVNIFCWIRIASAAFSLMSLIGVSMMFGAGAMLLNLFLSVLSACIAGLQIWLIAETDYMF
jgi:hypothetical protein